MFNKSRAKFFRWLREAHDNQYNLIEKGIDERKSRLVKKRPTSGVAWTSTSVSTVSTDVSLNSSGIYFKVVPGNGGIVIEVTHYENKTDSEIITLHVIPEGEEISETIAKIITIESMRRS